MKTVLSFGSRTCRVDLLLLAACPNICKATTGSASTCVGLIDNKRRLIDTILRQEVNKKVNSSMRMVSAVENVPPFVPESGASRGDLMASLPPTKARIRTSRSTLRM